MRCIIAGSRSITDYSLVEEAVRRSGFVITEVVSGRARGVDQLGEQWAAHHDVRVRCFPAQWSRFGRRAGILRNEQMIDYVSQGPEAGVVVAIWNGASPGTQHTIQLARRRGLQVFVLTVRPASSSGVQPAESIC